MGTRTEEIIKGKSENVDLLSKQIEEYGAFLVFEYLSLNSEDISILRKKLRESQSKLIVHKNNTLNRAFKKLSLNNSEELVGPNAILLTKGDIKPFQDIIKLSKEKEFIKLKLAYFDKSIIEKGDLNMLASLGTKEDMLAKLCQTMLSPLYKLMFVLKAVKKE